MTKIFLVIIFLAKIFWTKIFFAKIFFAKYFLPSPSNCLLSLTQHTTLTSSHPPHQWFLKMSVTDEGRTYGPDGAMFVPFIYLDLQILFRVVTSMAVLYSALYLCVHSPNCACMPPSLASSHADLWPATLVTTVTTSSSSVLVSGIVTSRLPCLLVQDQILSWDVHQMSLNATNVSVMISGVCTGDWRHRTRCVTGGNCRAAVTSRYYHQSRGRRRTECRRLGDGRGRSQRGIPPPRTAQPAGLSTPMCTQDLIVNSAIINYASFSQLTYSQYNGKSISTTLFVTL